MVLQFRRFWTFEKTFSMFTTVTWKLQYSFQWSNRFNRSYSIHHKHTSTKTSTIVYENQIFMWFFLMTQHDFSKITFNITSATCTQQRHFFIKMCQENDFTFKTKMDKFIQFAILVLPANAFQRLVFCALFKEIFKQFTWSFFLFFYFFSFFLRKKSKFCTFFVSNCPHVQSIECNRTISIWLCILFFIPSVVLHVGKNRRRPRG